MQFIDLKKQKEKIENSLIQKIKKILDEGKYIMGPEVFELEESLKNFLNVKYSLTCANGTDALLISLLALNIKKGDAVFALIYILLQLLR